MGVASETCLVTLYDPVPEYLFSKYNVFVRFIGP
jgi:hypothetical protein